MGCQDGGWICSGCRYITTSLGGGTDQIERQTAEVVDVARNELLEIQQTGTLKDEKLLADYRKRKLAEKK